MNRKMQNMLVLGIGLFAAYKFLQKVMPGLHAAANDAAGKARLATQATSAIFSNTAQPGQVYQGQATRVQ